jgi:hypothetical protein
VSESELEETGTGEAAKRIGQAPTTTDVTDPERSSRNTAAGSGSEPGEGPVQPDADEGVDPSASIEPHNAGARLSTTAPQSLAAGPSPFSAQAEQRYRDPAPTPTGAGA